MFSPTDKITIVGVSGCGKSTLCKKLHESGIWKRVVVFDRMAEYDQAGFDATVHSFQEYCSQMKFRRQDPSFRILFRFDRESDGKGEIFNEALHVLLYAKNTLAVVEETWNFSSKSYIPKWYQELNLAGRHDGVGLISTSQRPQTIHNVILSQSAHIFIGQVALKRDLEYLADFVGDENTEKLKMLKRGEFLHWIRGNPEVKIISNRS